MRCGRRRPVDIGAHSAEIAPVVYERYYEPHPQVLRLLYSVVHALESRIRVNPRLGLERNAFLIHPVAKTPRPDGINSHRVRVVKNLVDHGRGLVEKVILICA